MKEINKAGNFRINDLTANQLLGKGIMHMKKDGDVLDKTSLHCVVIVAIKQDKSQMIVIERNAGTTSGGTMYKDREYGGTLYRGVEDFAGSFFGPDPNKREAAKIHYETKLRKTGNGIRKPISNPYAKYIPTDIDDHIFGIVKRRLKMNKKKKRVAGKLQQGTKTYYY